jgi:hypothetical protein
MAKHALRELMRKTGLHQHTVEAILGGENAGAKIDRVTP